MYFTALRFSTKKNSGFRIKNVSPNFICHTVDPRHLGTRSRIFQGFINTFVKLDPPNLCSWYVIKQIILIAFLSCLDTVLQTLTTAGVCLLKPSESYVCCGDVLGKVGVLDPMTLHTVASFSAHVAGMCDMDIVGNYLVTCGLGQQ